MITKWDTRLKWFVIVLPVTVLVLICTLAVTLYKDKQTTRDEERLIAGPSERYAPENGSWICEDLGLTLAFGGGDCVWDNNGAKTSCMIVSSWGSHYLRIFTIEAKIPVDGFGHPAYAYAAGSLLFDFVISSSTNDSMVVSDDAGNVYTFYRDDTGQEDGSVDPSPSRKNDDS